MTTFRLLPLLAVGMAILAHPAAVLGQRGLAAESRHPGLRRGEQIRVTRRGDGLDGRRTVRVTFDGFVLNTDGDPLLVGRDDRNRERRFLTEDIFRVRRQIGTHPASGRALAVGSGLGFVGGLVIGGWASTDRSGFVTSAMIGAPVGALVMWLFGRNRPVYEEVEIRAEPSVGFDRPSGLLLTMSIPAA